MDRYDVVVVGAGLSGLRTARLVADEGLSVLLTDQTADPSRLIRTTGIFVRRTLESFAFPPGMLGPPIRRVTLVSPRGRTLALESRHDEFRVGRMGSLSAHELERARSAGVVWLPEHRFEGIECLRRDTIVGLRDATGEPRMVRTRFLVGADGTFSAVAAALRLDRNLRWITAVDEVISGPDLVRLAIGGGPQLFCLLDPLLAPGYIAWATHDGEELHLGAGGYPERFRETRVLAEVRRLAGAVLAARGLLPDPAALEQVERRECRGGAIPVGGILERIGCIRGLLVGDAAGAPSPLTAGGLDPCLRLPQVAAAAVADHLLRDRQEVLRAYTGARFRPRFTSRLYARRLFDALDDPRLLEAACAILRLPPFRLLAREVFFGQNSFPDPRRCDPGPAEAGAPARPQGAS